jgi:hypothetical protein
MLLSGSFNNNKLRKPHGYKFRFVTYRSDFRTKSTCQHSVCKCPRFIGEYTDDTYTKSILITYIWNNSQHQDTKPSMADYPKRPLQFIRRLKLDDSLLGYSVSTIRAIALIILYAHLKRRYTSTKIHDTIAQTATRRREK